MFSTSCLFSDRVQTLGLREQNEWSLQPVMLRRDFFTKEIRRLLHGGEMVAVPSAALDAAGL
jgi:hypothetical protein